MKLGTGGLSRAYAGVVKLALASLPTEEKVERALVDVTVGYAEVDGLQRLVGEMDMLVADEEYGSRVTYRLGVPASEVETLRQRVADLTRGDGRVAEVDTPCETP